MMAPYLILSDIHGNFEALQAVLENAHGRYERILCLGDLVGYGADPNQVTEWVKSNVVSIVRGNHDRACTGTDMLEYFNPSARASALWTRGELTPANSNYLEHLARGPLRVTHNGDGGFDLVHGSPLDEDEYLVGVEDVQFLVEYLETKLTFFGHTHLQGGFLLAPRSVKRIVPDRVLQLEPDYYYLINPGSVGQPRDGDPRAAYALYSPEDRTIEYRRVPYDIGKAAAKILKAELPESLAMRLFEGV
ncbi:MAG: metallophosphatase family protein [Acidobacteriia bacterium]|nr:metallophosphatase family protein [Terriglobia bacterium]